MKRIIRRNQRRQKGKRIASASVFLSAALSIPGVGASLNASAQQLAEYPKLRFQYGYYEDYQSDADRMEVKGPMFSLLTPIGENMEADINYVVESISGASPLYLSTVSGASGIGIDDYRWALDGKLTRNFDGFSIGLGGTYSDEDDYRSKGGIIESKIWTSDKNSVFTVAAGFGNDDIGSQDDPTLDESRDSFNILLGITQILDPESLIQSNLTYVNGDGYFSDPYKSFDNRPRSRDQFISLTRYVLYLPEIESSLHTDYRLYGDSWGVLGHTVELALYYPFNERWMIRPNVRYYSQSAADFFSSEFPPSARGEIYSADQRLSEFGSIGGGVTLFYELTDGWSLDLQYEAFQQRPEFALGGGSAPIKNFYGYFLIFGITKEFK